jgi:hypothetical protein
MAAFYGTTFWPTIDTAVYLPGCVKRGRHENVALKVESFIFISLK